MKLLFFVLITGLIDCLNPATIITQLLILVKSKSAKLSAYFALATYVTYLAIGYLFSLGLTAILKNYIAKISISWNFTFVFVELLVLLVCVYFLINGLTTVKKPTERKSIFLQPLPIITLAIGSTLSDFPTALPYFAFIGKIEPMGFDMFTTFAYFSLYNFIYILPLLVLLFLYRNNQDYFEIYFKKIESFIDALGKIVLYVLLSSCIVIFSIDILLFFHDGNSIWNSIGFKFSQ